jgi:hypothetical protein
LNAFALSVDFYFYFFGESLSHFFYFVSFWIGSNDIEIRNGTVWGFTGNGIFADTGTTKLYIHDIVTKFNGVRDTTAVAPGSNAGISIIGNFMLSTLINDVYIKDVQSYGNGGIVTGSGLQIIYANRIKIERFIGNDNGLVLNPFTPLGDNGFGVFLNNCNDIECINCTTDHNGGNILGYGIYAQLSIGMSCTQCIANAQLAGFALDGGLGSKVAGIALEQVANFVLRECLIADSVNFSTVTGLGVDANGVSGISVLRCIYGLLEGCHVNDSNAPNGTANFCHGFSVLGNLFGDLSNCKDIVFKNCSAKNIGQTSSVLDAIGFSTRRDDIISNGTQDLIFDNCVVEGVSGGGSNNNGFWLYDSLRSIIKNSTIKDCVSGIGAAIMVDGAGASLTKNLLINNILHSNTEFGIFNTGNTTDTAAINNYAYHNAGGNFIGLPANTAIQTWVVGGGPIAAQTTPSFDNFDIVQPS